MVTGERYINFVKFGHVFLRYVSGQTNPQTHADRSTSHPSRGQVVKGHSEQRILSDSVFIGE